MFNSLRSGIVTHPCAQCHILAQKLPIVMNEMSLEMLTLGLSNDMKFNSQHSLRFPEIVKITKFPNLQVKLTMDI